MSDDKAEGWAAAKAKTRPMRRVASLREFAVVRQLGKKLGDRVLEDAKKAHVSDKDVAAMKKRMNGWMDIVRRYHEEIRDVMNDEKIGALDKRILVGDMWAALEDQRREMFG